MLLVKVVPPALTLISPLMVNAELPLFSVIAVTELSILLLMVAVPEPVPELMIVPVLLTSAVSIRVVPVLLSLMMTLPVVVIPPCMVKPLATAHQLLTKVKFPVPLIGPVTVNNVVPELLLLVKVVPPALTVILPLMVSAESGRVFRDRGYRTVYVAVDGRVPVPEPELVIVPVLLTSAVLIRVVPVLLSLMIILPVVVIPP